MIREKDRLLLAELMKDSRQKIIKLAKNCHMTRQSVYSKINEYRRRGIKFSIDVNPEDLEMKLKVYILIVAEPQSKFREEADNVLRTFKEVSQVHHILGRFDIIVEAILRNREELTKLLKKIQSLPAVKKTETFIVYETVKLNPKEPLLEGLSKTSDSTEENF